MEGRKSSDPATCTKTGVPTLSASPGPSHCCVPNRTNLVKPVSNVQAVRPLRPLEHASWPGFYLLKGRRGRVQESEANQGTHGSWWGGDTDRACHRPQFESNLRHDRVSWLLVAPPHRKQAAVRARVWTSSRRVSARAIFRPLLISLYPSTFQPPSGRSKEILFCKDRYLCKVQRIQRLV